MARKAFETRPAGNPRARRLPAAGPGKRRARGGAVKRRVGGPRRQAGGNAAGFPGFVYGYHKAWLFSDITLMSAQGRPVWRPPGLP